MNAAKEGSLQSESEIGKSGKNQEEKQERWTNESNQKNKSYLYYFIFGGTGTVSCRKARHGDLCSIKEKWSEEL